jgi:hypothetical protein
MLDTYVSFMHSLKITFRKDKQAPMESKVFYFVGVDIRYCVHAIYEYIDSIGAYLISIEVIDNDIRVDVRIPAMIKLTDVIPMTKAKIDGIGNHILEGRE